MLSERESTKILDYLGDSGGFYGAAIVIFSLAGQFFSSSFFLPTISQDLYTQKKSQLDKTPETNNNKEKMK